MNTLKRFPVKYIRDYIKKDYKLRDQCYICGVDKNLELHHLYSLSQLWNSWLAKHKIKHIEGVEQIKNLRETFSKDCADSLSNEHLITLCSSHHKQLHTVYGQNYLNHLVPKIRNWLEIQKEKISG